MELTPKQSDTADTEEMLRQILPVGKMMQLFPETEEIARRFFDRLYEIGYRLGDNNISQLLRSDETAQKMKDELLFYYEKSKDRVENDAEISEGETDTTDWDW